jgi:hypothetical protein
MKIARDGNWTFAIDVARFWLGENGKLLILLLGLTILSILGLQFLTRQYAGPGVYEEAEVVRFGGAGSSIGGRYLVVVRIADNSLRTLRANVQDIIHCHVGGRIRLVRHGAAYAVNGPSCAPGTWPPHDLTS